MNESRLEATFSLGRWIQEGKRAWKGLCHTCAFLFSGLSSQICLGCVCIHLETRSHGNGVPLFFSFKRFCFVAFFFTEGPPCPRHHTKWRKGALSQKRVFIEFVLFARKTNIAYTNKCKVSAVKVL